MASRYSIQGHTPQAARVALMCGERQKQLPQAVTCLRIQIWSKSVNVWTVVNRIGTVRSLVGCKEKVVWPSILIKDWYAFLKASIERLSKVFAYGLDTWIPAFVWHCGQPTFGTLHCLFCNRWAEYFFMWRENPVQFYYFPSHTYLEGLRFSSKPNKPIFSSAVSSCLADQTFPFMVQKIL